MVLAGVRFPGRARKIHNQIRKVNGHETPENPRNYRWALDCCSGNRVRVRVSVHATSRNPCMGYRGLPSRVSNVPTPHAGSHRA
nr:MAG TPA: hypothetical protein [Caudoviricetes sp.]